MNEKKAKLARALCGYHPCQTSTYIRRHNGAIALDPVSPKGEYRGLKRAHRMGLVATRER